MVINLLLLLLFTILVMVRLDGGSVEDMKGVRGVLV